MLLIIFKVKLNLQHIFCKIGYHIKTLVKHPMSCGKVNNLILNTEEYEGV